MPPILSNTTWVSLSNEVRQRIRSIFNIPCSSSTIVSDGRIETDGTTPEDLKHLTIEKMQKLLNSELNDFHKLFDLVVVKITGDIEAKRITEFPIINANIIQDVKSTKKSSKK
jgi:hypothetical protein